MGRGLACEGRLNVALTQELGLRGTWVPLGLLQWNSGLNRPRMLVWVTWTACLVRKWAWVEPRSEIRTNKRNDIINTIVINNSNNEK